jgi:transcriptional regulator with XRE-family HTH domain
VLKQQVAEVLAGNIRAYRLLRGHDQADLAERMQSLGFGWRPATVSEIERERGGRNVTVAEMLGLVIALETPMEQLVDPRGPEGWRGPDLVITDQGADSVVLPPQHVRALLARRDDLYFRTEWVENDFQSLIIGIDHVGSSGR